MVIITFILYSSYVKVILTACLVALAQHSVQSGIGATYVYVDRVALFHKSHWSLVIAWYSLSSEYIGYRRLHAGALSTRAHRRYYFVFSHSTALIQLLVSVLRVCCKLKYLFTMERPPRSSSMRSYHCVSYVSIVRCVLELQRRGRGRSSTCTLNMVNITHKIAVFPFLSFSAASALKVKYVLLSVGFIRKEFRYLCVCVRSLNLNIRERAFVEHILIHYLHIHKIAVLL